LGRWNFWLMFVGFNLGFFPMHISGLMGMPRRVYTFQEGMGLDTLNLLTTIGAYILAIGFLLFIINVLVSLKRGELAGPDPWRAGTLEWTAPSPPPPYNFVVLPTLATRAPLWEAQLGEGPYRSNLAEGMPLDHGKEALASTTLDAQPEAILRMPEDSLMPLLLALALTALFAGLIIKLWWLVVVSFLAGLIFELVWIWPREQLGERRPA
jgi:hypothetical protein